MVTPRALTTPAVKPSSASLRPGVASLAAAAGSEHEQLAEHRDGRAS